MHITRASRHLLMLSSMNREMRVNSLRDLLLKML